MAKKKQEDIISEIIRDIKAKKAKPIYFLSGEEPYYIDKIADFIEENVLEEHERDFNQTILYGNDTDVSQIIGAAKRFPMMAEKQVVIIREAQGIADLGRETAQLEEYVDNPQESTVLVFCYKYKKVDKRKAVYKKIAKDFVLFEGKKLYDNEYPDWIIGLFRKKGYTVDIQTVQLLFEYLGEDMSKISLEVDKLCSVVAKGSEITSDHIEKYIGISKEYNNFELVNALRDRDVLKANKIINFFSKNPKDHPILGTLPLLYNYFSKILIVHSLKDKSSATLSRELGVNPYFVKDYLKGSAAYDLRKTVRIISYLREADVRAKGVGVNAMPQRDNFQELIYKILH